MNYGDQYNKLSEQRLQFQSLKKELANLTKILESIQRHKETLAAKGGKDNEQANQNFQKCVKEELANMKTLMKTILPLVDVVESTEFKDRYKNIRSVLEQSENDFKNKEELEKHYQQIQIFSRNLFADSNKIMDQMKKIKKGSQQPN